MRVLGVLGTYHGSGVYRVIVPFKELRRKGVKADWVMMQDVERMAPVLERQNYNVMVLAKVVPKEGFLEAVDHAGKRMAVIYETDDDVLAPEWLDKNLPVELLRELWHKVDAITVSTDTLGKVMRQYNENVCVLPNCLERGRWSKRWEREIDALTIGMTGGYTHHEDWRLALGPFMRIADEYPDVHFVFCGYLPDYMASSLPEDRLHFYGWAPFEDYPQRLAQIDIGVATLLDSQMARARDSSKIYEYWASGCAVVASDVVPYRRVINKKNGVLVRNSQDLYRALKDLIEWPLTRLKLAEAGKKWLWKNRDIRTRADDWLRVYRKYMRRVHYG